MNIEHGIPLRETRGKKPVYDIGRMAVGDSMRVKISSVSSLRVRAKALGIKIAARREDDMVRVWRTA